MSARTPSLSLMGLMVLQFPTLSLILTPTLVAVVTQLPFQLPFVQMGSAAMFLMFLPHLVPTVWISTSLFLPQIYLEMERYQIQQQ